MYMEVTQGDRGGGRKGKVSQAAARRQAKHGGEKRLAW